MDDVAHVGLVDPEAERGVGRDDDLDAARAPLVVHALLLTVVDVGVICRGRSTSAEGSCDEEQAEVQGDAQTAARSLPLARALELIPLVMFSLSARLSV